MKSKIRALVAKPGLDGHDRGAKVIAFALRDAGFETIYSGLRQSTKAIVNIAMQEDVDVILLSSLSGAHDYLFPKIMQELREKGVDDILVIGGGVIPKEDIPALKAAGIQEVFGPGTPTKTIVAYLKNYFEKR